MPPMHLFFLFSTFPYIIQDNKRITKRPFVRMLIYLFHQVFLVIACIIGNYFPF